MGGAIKIGKSWWISYIYQSKSRDGPGPNPSILLTHIKQGANLGIFLL